MVLRSLISTSFVNPSLSSDSMETTTVSTNSTSTASVPACSSSVNTVTFGTTTVFGPGGSVNPSSGGATTGTSQLPSITSTISPAQQQQQQNQPDLAGIFSIIFNRTHHSSRNSSGLPTTTISSNNNNALSNFMMNSSSYSGGGGRIWPTFSMSHGGNSGNRSSWTKYCLLCTICGSASTILAGIFLIIAVLFRYYTTSIYYFETVPTYIPAILLSICGISTIAFSCKRNRNIILLRITACWSLVSAALSSVITITTSLIHMNRLQTLKECVYNKNPASCTCFGQTYGLDSNGGYNTDGGGNGGSLHGLNDHHLINGGNNGDGNINEPLHFVFENTMDCDVIHGALYSCLRAVFAISVVAVLLSIFLCMLLYQLIGHERKKAYWSRIRRINSDWSSDFLACLPRNLPRERSGLMPLVLTPSASLGLGSTDPILHHLPSSWGPPPPYEPTASTSSIQEGLQPPIRRSTFNSAPFYPLHSYATSTASSNNNQLHSFIADPHSSFTTTNFPSSITIPSSMNLLLTSNINSSHPFSPTITSLTPSSTSSSSLGAGLPYATSITTAAASAVANSSSSFTGPTSISAGNLQSYSRTDNNSDNNDNFEERQEQFAQQQQQQLKIDRRMNFIPKFTCAAGHGLPGIPPLALRESKISISSDSDNLYSIDDDLFNDPNREKELETKINNQIISLLLAAEKEGDFDGGSSKSRKVPPVATGEITESNCSSLMTLQNADDDDFCLPSKKSITVNSNEINNMPNTSKSSNNGRIISSLPSSPFLNNVKKYFRERTNSLRLIASPKSGRRKGGSKSSINYKEFDVGSFKTEEKTGGGIVATSSSSFKGFNTQQQRYFSHENPNYSFDSNSIKTYSTNTLTIPTKESKLLESFLAANNISNDTNLNSGSNIIVKSTIKSLKSQSLPGSPMKKKIIVQENSFKNYSGLT